MQHKVVGILALLICSFLLAGPASAVTLNQCTPDFPGATSDFVLVGQDNIIFEPQSANSGREINGNVLVTSTSNNNFSTIGRGFVRVGSNLVVNGTVIADVVILPDAGATITHCVANRFFASTAAARASCPEAAACTPYVGGACSTSPAAFTAYAAAHPTCVTPPATFSSDFCGPTPVIQACANTGTKLTLGPGDTLTLPSPTTTPPNAKCFGDLVLGAGAVLNLGDAGPFSFKTVTMGSGARLIGPAGGATVNVNGRFRTETGAIITDINLNVAFVANPPGEVVEIFNNAILTRTVINAPFGRCHFHTGDAFVCTEACCRSIDVQPITAECDNLNLVCVCPANSSFADDASRACVCNPGFHVAPGNQCVPD